MESMREIPGLIAALMAGLLVALAESRVAVLGLLITGIGIGLTGGALLTVADGFTNQGTIEMTGQQNFFSQLWVRRSLVKQGSASVEIGANCLCSAA